MTAYYNEIDPYAAQWLRNLIAAGLITDGVVDERSIEDVKLDDLIGYTQCHFFAGIGGWSYALRRAGWADNRRVWTASCPCQPFSAAGKGGGFADERHLWPALNHLAIQCDPAIILGEQVASKDADSWIDLVHADLEALGYAFGSVPFPSAGIGAPHIRDRNYWVAHASGARSPELVGRRKQSARLATNGTAVRMADNHSFGFSASAIAAVHDAEHHVESRSSVCGLADADSSACGQGGSINSRRDSGGNARTWSGPGGDGMSRIERPGPTNGFWRDADWLGCTDGKWRSVEPSTFPLAHGATARVGRLRAYGNAINVEAAKTFIECVMESL